LRRKSDLLFSIERQRLVKKKRSREKYEERQKMSYLLRRMKVKKFIYIADQKEILNGEGKKERKKI